jgi:hypothetical protein
MNPLASTQPVRRVLTLISALSLIILSVACGSGNSATPNQVGFSTSSLSGTYVFSSQGVDVFGDPLTVAGALVADGKGGIASGTLDVVDAPGGLESPVAQSITGGSYSVGTDGRGHASLNSTNPLGNSFNIDFVLTSSSHGLVTEFDGNGTGSGTIDLQTPITSLSQLAGPYAFSLGGADSNDNPFATAGAFTLNSSGTTTTPGIEDFNDNGVQFTPGNLSATATLGSGTGPGSLILSANFGPLTFDYYPIDITHFKVIETDGSQFLAGDAFTQTGAAIPTGQMAFTMAGGSNNIGPVAVGGIMTSNGSGAFTAGLEDYNIAGTVSPSQVNFSGTPAGAAGVGGRVAVTLSGFAPALQWVVYPSAGGLLLLETDQVTVTAGTAYAQTSTTLAEPQGYGFNLSAFNIAVGVEEDDIAQFTTATSGFSGAVDINDEGSTASDRTLTGTYPIPLDSTGRGGVSTNDFNYYFYVVSPSNFLVLEVDDNQIGAGTFQFQTTPAGSVSQSHMSMVHPTIRAHGALKRKSK